jgi:hypothetical protein
MRRLLFPVKIVGSFNNLHSKFVQKEEENLVLMEIKYLF